MAFVRLYTMILPGMLGGTSEPLDRNRKWPKSGSRFLVLYSFMLTAVFAITVYGAAAPKKTSFDEIDVHRINVVEPDGTLRMVISDHARLPGIIVHGREKPFARPLEHEHPHVIS
jgi:hypothetical protein